MLQHRQGRLRWGAGSASNRALLRAIRARATTLPGRPAAVTFPYLTTPLPGNLNPPPAACTVYP